MEHLIIKYLQKELTEKEERQIKAWLQEDINNRRVFENIVSMWEIPEQVVKESQRNVLHEIRASPSHQELMEQDPGIWRYLVAVAIMVLFGLLFVFQEDPNSDTEVIPQTGTMVEKKAAFGQRLTATLPDGSTVRLNGGSHLTYPKDFSDTVRQVSLTGEGFFEVVRDEARPFRIISGEVNVHVLGTSFNVRCYQEEETEVSVKTGSVAVSANDSSAEVVLKPNEWVAYNPKERVLRKEVITNPEAMFGWTEGILLFEEQSIQAILNTLSRWYGKGFKVSKTLNNQKHFTAKYKNGTLKQVLESLSFAYDFNFKIKENDVMIY